jgi:hypothetical protein
MNDSKSIIEKPTTTHVGRVEVRPVVAATLIVEVRDLGVCAW